MKLQIQELLEANIGNFYLLSGRERDIDILKKRISKDKTFIKIIRGYRCKTKKSLFQEFAAVLQFPYYFGNNWDAFDECITDFSWLPSDKYIIFITQFENVLSEDSDELRTFFIILKDAIVEWSKVNNHRPIKNSVPFLIVFQCETENEKNCLEILRKENIKPVLRNLEPFDEIK